MLDNNIAKPALGELAFKIDETQSAKILKFTDRRFFITNGNVTAQPNATVAVASIPLTTQTPVSNESTSVLFWGYWKKEGEVIVLPTDTATVTPTSATVVTPPVMVTATPGNDLAGSITQVPPKNILQSILPASIGNTATNTGNTTSVSNTNQQLKGTALTSALAAQMQGFVATGWADQTIVDYFLTPGKPGYITYPGLTKAQFKIAANGILSTATLSNIVIPIRATTSVRNTKPGASAQNL